jgi:hypothetical protein
MHMSQRQYRLGPRRKAEISRIAADGANEAALTARYLK